MEESVEMADVVFVLVALGFLALCLLYVRGCEAIVRSGEASESAAEAAGRVAGQSAGELVR
jgi:hypothetical protein